MNIWQPIPDPSTEFDVPQLPADWQQKQYPMPAPIGRHCSETTGINADLPLLTKREAFPWRAMLRDLRQFVARPSRRLVRVIACLTGARRADWTGTREASALIGAQFRSFAVSVTAEPMEVCMLIVAVACVIVAAFVRF